MVIRRSPRNLPGMDPFLLPRITAAIFLCLLVMILALAMATAAAYGAQRGHLPWPIAQWAFTTPLGALAVDVVGGLVWGLPVVWIALARPFVFHPVDVTELPPIWWPRPSSPWSHWYGRSLADIWLGSGRSERAWSLLALVFAPLLIISLLAVAVASTWYGLSHIPYCEGSGCPPSFSQFTAAPEIVGLAIIQLGTFARIAHLERRCGVWFRTRDVFEGLGAYIRRPGVSSVAAAAALKRNTRSALYPLARVILIIALAVTPGLLVMSGGILLSSWLASQWIPA